MFILLALIMLGITLLAGFFNLFNGGGFIGIVEYLLRWEVWFEISILTFTLDVILGFCTGWFKEKKENWFDWFDMFIFGVTALLAVVSGYVLHHDIIFEWIQDNGFLLNLIYLSMIFLIIFFNVMKNRSGHTVDLVNQAFAENGLPIDEDRKKQKSLLSWFLFPPAIIVGMYTGVPTAPCDMTIIPFSEWAWGTKIVLVAFLLVFVKFLLVYGLIGRNWAQVWSALALVGNMTAVSYGYLLLRIIQGEGYFTLVIMPVEFGLLFYSYIFVLICALDLISFGEFSTARRKRAELEAVLRRMGVNSEKEALKAFKKQLDNRERMFNAALGRGIMLTDQDAYMAGKMDDQEFLNSHLLREQQIDKFRERNRK